MNEQSQGNPTDNEVEDPEKGYCPWTLVPLRRGTQNGKKGRRTAHNIAPNGNIRIGQWKARADKNGGRRNGGAVAKKIHEEGDKQGKESKDKNLMGETRGQKLGPRIQEMDWAKSGPESHKEEMERDEETRDEARRVEQHQSLKADHQMQSKLKIRQMARRKITNLLLRSFSNALF